jgi:hypothetical protein
MADTDPFNIGAADRIGERIERVANQRENMLALALIEAAAPRNEVEGALAVQMACAHAAAMAILARFRGGGGSEGRVAALATAAARLLRAYSVQVETLRRLRHGGDQYVRVEHVHVNDGGQAIVGNVKSAGSGAAGSPEHSARELIAPAPSRHRD